jgi:hypothetical protein
MQSKQTDHGPSFACRRGLEKGALLFLASVDYFARRQLCVIIMPRAHKAILAVWVTWRQEPRIEQGGREAASDRHGPLQVFQQMIDDTASEFRFRSIGKPGYSSYAGVVARKNLRHSARYRKPK